MSVLHFDGTDDEVRFTPISSALANLPNGAATIAALVRKNAAADDIVGLANSAHTTWYHGLGFGGSDSIVDDDGLVGVASSELTVANQTQAAGNYQIVVVDWPAGGAALERFHASSLMSAAESWTHNNSGSNNGGNRAGPGTSGHLRIGQFDSEGDFSGDIALLGIWAGTRFSDANVEALWVNKKTSDWYNHSAGTPTTLIEFNTSSPTDIGANPSTFASIVGATLNAPDPTGWTFDGTGTTPGWSNDFSARYSATGFGERGAIFVSEKEVTAAAESTYSWAGTADQASAAIAIFNKTTGGPSVGNKIRMIV